MITVKIHDTYLPRENLEKHVVVICTQLILGKLYQVLAIRQLEEE